MTIVEVLFFHDLCSQIALKQRQLDLLLAGTLLATCHQVCSQQTIEMPSAGDLIFDIEVAIVRFLKHLTVNEETRTTRLTEAASWERLELANDILREGLPVNTQDRSGRSTLTLTAVGGPPEIDDPLLFCQSSHNCGGCLLPQNC